MLRANYKQSGSRQIAKTFQSNGKLIDARTRSVQKDSLLVVGKGLKLQSTFYSGAASLWNKAPDCIKNAKSFYTVKKEIKSGYY